MKKMIVIFVSVFVLCLIVLMNLPKSNEELFIAIKEKRTSEVRAILEKYKINLDPAQKPNEVNKPLAYAAAYGNLDIVKMLLKKGADINGQVAYGDVPIIKAMEHDNMNIVKYLIVNGADVNIPNAFGVSPFIGFCGLGKMDLVKMSLSHKAKVNESYVQRTGELKGKKNWTPLQSSIVYGKLDVIQLLIENGADPYVKGPNGKNCFELAKDKEQIEVLNYLLMKYKIKK